MNSAAIIEFFAFISSRSDSKGFDVSTRDLREDCPLIYSVLNRCGIVIRCVSLVSKEKKDIYEAQPL